MPLQDEMEGLDLEGKMYNDGVDLLEKLLSAVWSLEFSSTNEPDDNFILFLCVCPITVHAEYGANIQVSVLYWAIKLRNLSSWELNK